MQESKNKRLKTRKKGSYQTVLGTVSKLSFILKRLNFKQSLIYTWLNFQNDGFDS